MDKYNIHIISDSTGETAHLVARACLAQFKSKDINENLWPFVRTEHELKEVIENISQQPGPVIATLLNRDLVETLKKLCIEKRIPFIDLIGPALDKLGEFMGGVSVGKPGLQHVLDQKYFDRIDAMQFVLNHDDGQLYHEVKQADVILLGVSRTSKTPTSIYLANRGIKALNIPIVPGIELPSHLFELKDKLIVGLTCDPKRLVEIRKNRIETIHSTQSHSSYCDIDDVKQEVVAAKRLFFQHKWPVIDITRRSIEETAAEIISIHRKYIHEKV